MEQMPPPGGPAGMGGPPMGGPPPMMGGAPGGTPDWNALAMELGIEPEDLKKQVFIGSWIGPSKGDLSNLRAFTVHAVDHKGDRIKGMQVDFLPTTKSGSKGVRDMVQGRHSHKWEIIPRGARVTRRVPRYVDYDWFNKVIFQDKSAGGGGGQMPGAVPGPGGMPTMTGG